MSDFLLIIAITVAIVFIALYFLARKEITRLDEERLLIHQEKQLVVDFMHDLVEALGEGLSREDLFQRIVRAAVLSTGALSACVFEQTGEGKLLKGVAVEGLFPPQNPLPESSKVKLTTRAKFIEQILKSETVNYGEGLIGTVAETGKAVLIQNGNDDPRICKHDDPALEVKSIIAAPIVFRDRLIGVLAVANPVDGTGFNETDFSLMQSLADQAGLAIHNADLLSLQIEQKKMDLDLSLASNIQLMLLPKEYPRIRNLDIDAVYIPAQKVGGDLYDFFPLSETRMGVAIADVSGKGIPASLMMTICRCTLRHFSVIHDSPARVLSEVNRTMSPDLRQDMFITLIFGIVDTEKNEVVFARAGHELPLVAYHDPVTGTQTSEMVGSEGVAVGLMDAELFDTIIEDKRIPFDPGSVLVFYTDGVTEAANEDGVEFSGGRLADTVKTLRSRSCRELNAGIIHSVERFAGPDGITDDISLVTIKHLSAGEEP